jgi:acyl-CoA oxidase
MSPTIPAGTPCVAIVWARLKVGTEDRGIRPFIVLLNDGHTMYPGVTAK